MNPSLRITTLLSPSRQLIASQTVGTAFATGAVDISVLRQSQKQQQIPTQIQSNQNQGRNISPTREQQNSAQLDSAKKQMNARLLYAYKSVPIYPVQAAQQQQWKHIQPPQLNTQQQRDEDRSFSVTFKGIDRLNSKQDKQQHNEDFEDEYEQEEVAFIAKTEEDCIRWVKALSDITGLKIECSDFITEELRKQLPFEYQSLFTS
ncbi:MAG: hypothetical protein EZS28_001667 [Streblomastix strix]|uniref:Uncharacterized protein n=1 Tax=Streblomastix strix TaxID=222440 RepID=A0A5J4X7I2_9EUKA|nr:MAG: hypothetical protein EZS28_001667 [Streblomastix strix]